MKTFSQQHLTSEGARQLLSIGREIAVEKSVKLCFAVTDRAGHLLAFERMDGAGLVSIDVAIGKAKTAAYLGMPARFFEEKIDGGAPSILTVPGIVPLRGGIPVKVGDEIVGAFGVSGAAGETDEAIAEAVVDRFIGVD